MNQYGPATETFSHKSTKIGPPNTKIKVFCILLHLQNFLPVKISDGQVTLI